MRYAAVFALVFLSACAQRADTTTPTQPSDPVDDVELTGCTPVDDTMAARIQVTNHSDEQSAYIVKVELTTEDGIHTASRFVSDINPGQSGTAILKAYGKEPPQGGYTCAVLEVNRLSDL